MKNLGLAVLMLLISPLSLVSDPQFKPYLTFSERDRQIDAALYYYYSGKTEAAREVADNLKRVFPADPFFYELKAEIIWQDLEKRVANGRPKNAKTGYGTVRKNQYLVERFYSEIFDGLVLTQDAIERGPGDSKNMFLRGMLLARLGGFIAKFEPGMKSMANADRQTAEGIWWLQRSMEIDRSLCSAKYLFALSRFIILNEGFLNQLAIRYYSKVFAALGGSFSSQEMFAWLEESMSCKSSHYYTKDVEIDKKLVYQDILMKQSGRMDGRALPLLEELNTRFPENTIIRDNLFLVKLHQEQKARLK